MARQGLSVHSANGEAVYKKSSEGGAAECNDALSAFATSCSKVTDGIVGGSLGDLNDVMEYMSDVCNQAALSGWHQSTCFTFSKSITSRLSSDNLKNREKYETGKACGSLWSHFVDEQKSVEEQAIAERKEQEKKDAEVAAEESEKAAAKAEKLKSEEAEAEKEAKAKEEAEAEAGKKRLAEAKAEVAKSMDQEKAKIKAVTTKAEEKMKEATAAEKEAATVEEADRAKAPPAPVKKA